MACSVDFASRHHTSVHWRRRFRSCWWFVRELPSRQASCGCRSKRRRLREFSSQHLWSERPPTLPPCPKDIQKSWRSKAAIIKLQIWRLKAARENTEEKACASSSARLHMDFYMYISDPGLQCHLPPWSYGSLPVVWFPTVVRYPAPVQKRWLSPRPPVVWVVGCARCKPSPTILPRQAQRQNIQIATSCQPLLLCLRIKDAGHVENLENSTGTRQVQSLRLSALLS